MPTGVQEPGAVCFGTQSLSMGPRAKRRREAICHEKRNRPLGQRLIVLRQQVREQEIDLRRVGRDPIGTRIQRRDLRNQCAEGVLQRRVLALLRLGHGRQRCRLEERRQVLKRVGQIRYIWTYIRIRSRRIDPKSRQRTRAGREAAFRRECH